MKKRVLGAFLLAGSIGVSICSYAASPASKEYVDRLYQELQAQITPTYTVGQQALGGTVFYTNSAGTHGLVVANTDQTTLTTAVNWYQAFDLVTAPNVYDSAGVLYTDWIVPSAAQLGLLCSAVPLVPALSSVHYWSATLEGLDTVGVTEQVLKAGVVNMSSCPTLTPISNELATLPFAVRAIRSF